METASYALLLHSKSVDELDDSGPKEDIELGLSVSGAIEVNKKLEGERDSPVQNTKIEEEIDSPRQEINKKIEEVRDSPGQEIKTPTNVPTTPKSTDDLMLKEIKVEKSELEPSRNESKVVNQLCPMGLTCPLLHDDDHIKEYSHPDLLKLKKYLEDLKAHKEGKSTEDEDKSLLKIRDEVAFSRRAPSMLPANFSPSLLYTTSEVDSPRGQDRKLTQSRPSLQSSLHSEIFEWMRQNKIYERLLVPTSLNCPDMDLSLIVPGIFFEIIVLACRQIKIKEDDAKKIVSSALGKFPDFEEVAIARKMGKVLEKLEREVKTVASKVQTIVLERIAIIEQTKSRKTFACNRQFTFELLIQIIFVTLSALFGIISLSLYLTAPSEIKIISVLEAVTPLVFGVSLIFFYFISPIIREDETYQKKILRNILEIHWYGDQLATWVGPTYNVPTDKKIPFIFFVNPKKWCNRTNFAKYKYQLKREEKIRVNIPPHTELTFSRKDNLEKKESKRALDAGEEEPKLIRQNAKLEQGDEEIPALTRQKAKITRQISDYGAMTQVVSTLSKCKKNIVSLSFKNCYLDDDDIAILEPFLMNNASLTNLDLENNNIRSLGAQSLAKVISSNSSLEYLNLNYNSISTPGAKALADALAKNKKTHIWIDLQHNSKITEYDYIFSILATKSALAEQSLLVQLESMSKEDKRRIAWVLFIITITLLHCLAPGMTRLVQGTRFIGVQWFEKFIAIGHIITGSLCVPGLCLYIRGINNDLRDLEYRMVRIGAVMSQRKAQLLNQYKNQNSSQRWNWSMDLSTGKQLDFWLQLRDYTRRRDQTDTNLVVGALLFLDLILLFAIFGRVVVLGRAGDVFNILGLLDALSLAVVLTTILSHIVTINTEITEHREELASIRYHYALKCSNKPDNLTKLQKSKYQRISELVTLYDSAIYKLVNHDRPVRILGIGVDRDLVIKLVSVMVTIGVSGLGTLINAIQRSLRS